MAERKDPKDERTTREISTKVRGNSGPEVEREGRGRRGGEAEEKGIRRHTLPFTSVLFPITSSKVSYEWCKGL